MEPFDPWAPADPLGEALHFLRMNGAFYCRSELTAPWGLALPPMPHYLWFHVVTSGELWLRTADGERRRLGPGDVALVPGSGHDIVDAPDGHADDITELEHGDMVSDRYEVLHHGTPGGPPSTVICAAVRFEHPAAQNLVDALPSAITLQTDRSPRLELMHATLRLMAEEARTLQPGGEAVITRLADILVIQVLRAWIETDPAARTGWLGALQDRQVGGAISMIHRDPARAWTVAVLADELAMSRSAFSARFTALVGEPVMAYVTRWRMHVALSTLQEEGATIAQLAARLGYRSEAAFARAFKRVIGVAPGSVRGNPAEADMAVWLPLRGEIPTPA